MKFIDWFSGIGGFRRGMELAGHECIGFCEYDRFAVASYTSMHLITEEQREKLLRLDKNKRQKEILKEEYRNGEWYAPDVLRVYGGDIPRADCWCLGSPCQGFSVAGKQLGLEDDRSNLFLRITDLLRHLKQEEKPSYLFVENVKNMLSINGGWDYCRILLELASCGYDAEWEILNSKDFGVPQNRERCFIIGHLRGRGTREVFPLRRDAAETDLPEERKVEQIGQMGGGRYEENGSQAYRVYDREGLAPTLGTAQGGGREPHIQCIDKTVNDARVLEVANSITTREDRGVSIRKGEGTAVVVQGFNTEDDGTSRTIKYQYQKNSTPNFTDRGDRGATAVAVIDSDLRILNRGEECESKRVYDPSGISPTVAARDYKDAKKVSTGCRIRKLTPKECFRLQGWTDDYFEKAEQFNSDCQLYKQAGNGVTVYVIAEIAKRMEVEDAD